MGIRDEELKRITHYAKGLGIKLFFKPYVRGSHTGAEWITDGSEITIYHRPKESKTNLILKAVHELAHHIAWVHAGRTVDLDTDQALMDEDDNLELTREQRKLIYLTEKNDADYRESIFNEIGLKIPKYIFLADLALDIWIYQRYYISGKFPTYKSISRKRKELRTRYKGSQ